MLQLRIRIVLSLTAHEIHFRVFGGLQQDLGGGHAAIPGLGMGGRDIFARLEVWLQMQVFGWFDAGGGNY